MPANVSLRNAITGYKRTVRSNANHHLKAPNVFLADSTSAKVNALVKRRAAHLRRLEAIPMYKRIFERKEKLVIDANGEKRSLVLFKNGFTVGKEKARFVILLDEKLRGLILTDLPFSTSYKWAPLKIARFVRTGDKMHSEYLDFGITTAEKDFVIELSKQIERRERNIDFSVSHSERQVKRIRKLL